MTPSETFSLVVAIISGALSLVLSAIVWGAKAEKRLLEKTIDAAEERAKRAEQKADESSKALQTHALYLATLPEKLDRLELTDREQGREIDNLRSRLDRGARTLSQQVRVDTPSSDPPAAMPPMRPKLPSKPFPR